MKGETIKEKLSQIGKTQKELAELLGVTPQAINEILSATGVRSGSIEKIAQALEVLGATDSSKSFSTPSPLKYEPSLKTWQG